MPTIFGNLLGAASLRTNAKARAEESIGNVEISLVLDVSGSMGQRDANSSSGNSKIASLRGAADNFVRKMFDNVQPPGAPAGRLSMSIVPYNQQVSMGNTLAGIYNLSTDHTQNTCADIQLLGFDNLAIPPSDPLQRTMYGSSYDFLGQNRSISRTMSASGENCYERSYSPMMAFEDNESDLLNKVQSLNAGGDTAIDIGAKWGLALLDPSAQPVAQKLADLGVIDAAVANRPLAYPDGQSSVADSSMKVMILMTDGENTRTFSMKMAYRTGASGFYSTVSATDFSDQDMSNLYWYSEQRAADNLKPYYSFFDHNWHSLDEVGKTTTTQSCTWKQSYWGWYQDCTTNTTFEKKAPISIDWETIWGKGWTLQYVIKTFLLPPRQALDSSTTISSIYDEMAIASVYAQKDANLAQVCTAARDRGVLIFTVAVSAEQKGINALSNCSSGPSYEYTVGADDLNDAFSSIATQISTLRLTN